MQVFTALCLLLCISSAFAVRSQWKQLDRADPKAVIPVRFALTQRNLNILESTLLDISNPRSSNYGKWMTPQAITELVAPPKEISAKVTAFLKATGAKVEDRRDMVKMVAPVSLIEQVLKTTLYFFQHTTSNKVIIRAEGSYEIPSQIADHVDFVAGLYEFPSINKNKKVASADAQYDGYIVPYVINNLYNIPASFPVNAASSICLVEFQDDASYNKKDLKNFCTENAIVPEINVTHIVGPYSGSSPDAESTLDVQFGGAIAQNTSVWFWTVEDWMYDFATDFIAMESFPLVVSMSWGWPEPLQCQVGNCTGDETSQQYVNRTNIEFQKIGTMGVSLLAASGDQGAPGDGNAGCSKSGKNALSTIFPGASPWVLSVGATQLTNSTDAAADDAALPPICSKFSCATSTTELACSYPAALITSGGGFSDYVATPAYQQTAVNAYLSSGVKLPPSTDFNKNNRGFPDVSALGHNYLIDWAGQNVQVDGTSCSSPVVAAIVALLNSERLNNGKAPLGFVVPLFYEAWGSDNTIFNDITTGNNYCTESCCAKTGYEATKGWDPVTGLGTPNFAKLLAYVKTLP